MSSSARLAKGTFLRLGTSASPPVYTNITELREISGTPGGTPDLVDVTNHDTAGLFREYITGLIAGDQITCKANYLGDANQTTLRTLRDAGTIGNFQIVIPLATPKVITFTAYVMSWKVNTDIASQMELEFTLQTSATPVWT